VTDLVAKHLKALQRVKEVGVAVTFTRFEQSYDPEADTFGARTDTSVPGWCVEDIGSRQVVGDVTSRTEESTIKLLFVPDTYGGMPLTGDRVTWAGETRTVKSVDPIRPAGVALAAHVEVV